MNVETCTDCSTELPAELFTTLTVGDGHGGEEKIRLCPLSAIARINATHGMPADTLPRGPQAYSLVWRAATYLEQQSLLAEHLHEQLALAAIAAGPEGCEATEGTEVAARAVCDGEVVEALDGLPEPEVDCTVCGCVQLEGEAWPAEDECPDCYYTKAVLVHVHHLELQLNALADRHGVPGLEEIREQHGIATSPEDGVVWVLEPVRVQLALVCDALGVPVLEQHLLPTSTTSSEEV